MKQFILICLCLAVTACTEKKPPLSPTQIVNGQSIVMPPEFFVLPKPTSNQQTVIQSDTME